MDFNLLLAPIEQLMHAPACVFILVPVSIIAAVWERLEQTPSKYVPVVCLVLGMVLYPLLTPVSTVPATFPFPMVVLILNGFILGFIAWLMHKFLIKKLMDKYAPSDEPPTPPKP